MSIVARVLRTWRDPRGVMRGHLAAGPREDRALAALLGGCVLLFVAQWPALSRAAFLDPSIPLEARMSGAMMGTLFLAPPIAYALAAVSHLAARVMGGRGTWFGARMALFWSLLAIAPLALLNGLVAGFLGTGLPATIVGLSVLGAFLFFWISALAEAERAGSSPDTSMET